MIRMNHMKWTVRAFIPANAGAGVLGGPNRRASHKRQRLEFDQRGRLRQGVSDLERHHQIHLA